MRRRLSAVLVVLLLGPLAWALFAPASSATSVENGFVVTDTKLHQKKSFNPMVGNNPAFETPATSPTLSDCQTLPTSTAVKMVWNLKSDRPTKAQFALTWPAADANDVDFYMFSDEGDLVAESASGDPKESINVGGLDNATYWLCANNYTGANAGFTIEISANFLKLYEEPIAPPTPILHPSVKPTPTPTAVPTPSAAPAPTPSPEVIATPGPDGPLKDQSMVVVNGRKQASPSEGGPSGLAYGLLALTGVIALSGIGIVALRIRRDTTGV